MEHQDYQELVVKAVLVVFQERVEHQVSQVYQVSQVFQVYQELQVEVVSAD